MSSKVLPQKKTLGFDDLISQASDALKLEAYAKAILLASQAAGMSPQSTHAILILATATERSGQPQKALDILSHSPASENSADCLLLLSELSLQLGQAQQAITYLQKALSLNPKLESARINLIRIFRATGQHPQAYIQYLELQNLRELSNNEKFGMMESINNVEFHNNHLTQISIITTLLKDDSIDKRVLSNKVGDLLIQAYPDLAENYLPSLDHLLLSNPDFLELMTQFPMSNQHLDFFLTQTRKIILLKIAQQGEIPDELIKLCLAIAQQNFLNEYIHSESNDERVIVDEFIALLRVQTIQAGWIPEFSQAVIIILLMYESLWSLQKRLAGDVSTNNQPFNWPLDAELWPKHLHSMLEQQLLHTLEEIEFASHTKSLTKISDATPQAVRALYEENPYPRWVNCLTDSFDSLGQHLKLNYPQLSLSKEFFNRSPTILVAGCGTGKHAIEVAFLYPNAKVTAFDISLRSLGYAQRMAKKLQMSNVEFFHGDILELTPEIGSFDIIECCGVLHHLVDPVLGWSTLKNLLKPMGIMHIALYSRAARAEINLRREQIKSLNIPDTLQGMQTFRSALLAQKSDQYLLKFRDFYVTSEFRDLLFHPQETQYSLEEIHSIVESLNLNFIALQVEAPLRANLRQLMPSADELDWKSWSQFEQKYPFIFSGMYHFWCQNKK